MYKKIIVSIVVMLILSPFDCFSIGLYKTVYVRKNDNLEKVLAGANTRYVLRYNHDLSDYTNGITIGENCILDFRKGCLKGGKIVFNNTKVKAKARMILDNNIYSGHIVSEITYPEWFGAIGDGRADDTKAIQIAMDVSSSVHGILGKTYAVASATPYQHCLTVKNDSLALIINLLDINEYTTSDYRGRAVIFVDNKNYFSFKGEISSINYGIPISSNKSMSLEDGRSGIVCYGDCKGLEITLKCTNLNCGLTNGTLMAEQYLYRNGVLGLHSSSINVNAYRVAYPIALNYANNCDIEVRGEHMHRCVYLCGDNNHIYAQGRNYYGTAAPAHVLLLSNVIKEKTGLYRIVTCNNNEVTYRQLEGETENLQEGAVLQFQPLRLDLNNNIPHERYFFKGNRVSLYCSKVGGNHVQYLYKSFASNWRYDNTVGIDCVFNIYGDISSYLSYSSFEFYADSEDKITINNYTEQQLMYVFSYNGNPNSIYEINGNSMSRSFGTEDYPFLGTIRLKGNSVYVNTITGGAKILGNIYVEGNNLEIVQNEEMQSKYIHISKE